LDFLLNIMFWIILAIVFGVAELVVPGAVLIFLAASGLLVAVCIAMGLVETWIGVLTLWFVSSLVMIIALRGLVTRFAPGDVSFSNTDEILADIGQIHALNLQLAEQYLSSIKGLSNSKVVLPANLTDYQQ